MSGSLCGCQSSDVKRKGFFFCLIFFLNSFPQSVKRAPGEMKLCFCWVHFVLRDGLSNKYDEIIT